MKHKSSGYSLIEIMFVVGIIGILMAVMLPGFKGALNRVRRFATERIMDKVVFAIDQYNMDVGNYPGKRDGYLNALASRPQSVESSDYKGPYLDGIKTKADEYGNVIINDQWGRALEYNNPPLINRQYKNYELISYGANEEDPNGYISQGR